MSDASIWWFVIFSSTNPESSSATDVLLYKWDNNSIKIFIRSNSSISLRSLAATYLSEITSTVGSVILGCWNPKPSGASNSFLDKFDTSSSEIIIRSTSSIMMRSLAASNFFKLTSTGLFHVLSTSDPMSSSTTNIFLCKWDANSIEIIIRSASSVTCRSLATASLWWEMRKVFYNQSVTISNSLNLRHCLGDFGINFLDKFPQLVCEIFSE